MVRHPAQCQLLSVQWIPRTVERDVIDSLQGMRRILADESEMGFAAYGLRVLSKAKSAAGFSMEPIMTLTTRPMFSPDTGRTENVAVPAPRRPDALRFPEAAAIREKDMLDDMLGKGRR